MKFSCMAMFDTGVQTKIDLDSHILLVNNLSNNVYIYITHVVQNTTVFTSFQIVVSRPHDDGTLL